MSWGGFLFWLVVAFAANYKREEKIPGTNLTVPVEPHHSFKTLNNIRIGILVLAVVLSLPGAIYGFAKWFINDVIFGFHWWMR